jgi:acyl carrier protein
MLMEIEEAFDIEISDEDAKKLTTIGELCNYIDERNFG